MLPVARRCKECKEPYEFHYDEPEWKYWYCSEACRMKTEGSAEEPKLPEEESAPEEVPEHEKYHPIEESIPESEGEGQGYEGNPVEVDDSPDPAPSLEDDLKTDPA